VLERKVYDYHLRNFSTSHVHMMLSIALTKLIDKCESIFFVNTPDSLTSNDVISNTESPWLYHELSMTSLIRQKELSSYRDEILKSLSMTEGLHIVFPVKLDHLIKLDADDILAWQTAISGAETYPLDALYRYVKKRRKATLL